MESWNIMSVCLTPEPRMLPLAGSQGIMTYKPQERKFRCLHVGELIPEPGEEEVPAQQPFSQRFGGRWDCPGCGGRWLGWGVRPGMPTDAVIWDLGSLTLSEPSLPHLLARNPDDVPGPARLDMEASVCW
ncbi:hypothetical protein VULLAG_LOCUS3953 [Vulpes lagopus]